MKGIGLDAAVIEQLKSMRESGMPNRDIANCLGISVSTVYRYIGSQPHGLRANSVTPISQISHEEQPVPQNLPTSEPPKENVEDEKVPEAALIVEDRTLQLIGLFGAYRVGVKEKRVTVVDGDGNDAITIPFDQVETFAKEINAIAAQIKKGLRVGNEAW